ncbi:DUF4328 domain-containing protein [Nocardia aurea]|uniref:DUF4328 domain-containing protein n=1 Tax=Nocardia aurea TaxID=2144174 RepID=UPI0033BF59E5
MNRTIESQGIQRLRGHALTASTAVIIALLGPVAIAAATLTFGSSQDTSEAELGMGLVAIGFLLTVLVWPVAGILVIRWLVRARANAELLAPDGHRLSPGWAIAGWLVPLVNLVVPALVVTDIVRASNPTGRNLGVVGVWWSAWLAAPVLNIVGIISLNQLGFPAGTNVLAQCLLAAAAAYITAALSFRSLALTIARWQDERVTSSAGWG